MSGPMDSVPKTNYSERVQKVLLVGINGLPAMSEKNYAQKIVVATVYTYICLAEPGTAEASALWSISRIEDLGSGNSVITWADGNSKFDNVATDPTALSYS